MTLLSILFDRAQNFRILPFYQKERESPRYPTEESEYSPQES